jgi:hypothetical protein
MSTDMRPSKPGTSARLSVRSARPEDARACGQICYEAFRTLNEKHGFPPDFPAPEAAIGLLSMMFSDFRFYCVLAEMDGRVVGSNCLDERNPTLDVRSDGTVLRQKTKIKFGGTGLPLSELSNLAAQPRETFAPAPATRQKIGRNEPCPCGSGKKFKKCCGRSAATL